MKKLLAKGLVGVVGMTLIPTVISCSNNGRKQTYTNATQNGADDANQPKKENTPLTETGNSVTTDSPVSSTPIGGDGATNQTMTLEQKTNRAQAFVAAHSRDLTPLTYNDLTQLVSEHPNVPWQRGIGRFALTETCSYLLNVAQELGFKPSDIPLQNYNEVEVSNDADITKERDTTFKALGDMFNNIKEASDADKKARLDDSYYQRFHFWSSEGETLKIRNLKNAGLNVDSFGKAVLFGTNTEDDSFDFSKSLINFGNDNFTRVFTMYDVSPSSQVNLQQYFDANKPGAMITKFVVPELKDRNDVTVSSSFTKMIETTGMAETYPIEKASDREHNLNVLKAAIYQLSTMFDQEKAGDVTHLKIMANTFSIAPDTVNALQYIGEKLDAIDGYTIDDVERVYDKFNNGSHYFKAIETLLRGLEAPFNTNKTFNVNSTVNPLRLNGIIYSPVADVAENLYHWAPLSGKGAFVFKDAVKYIGANEKNGTIVDWRKIIYK